METQVPEWLKCGEIVEFAFCVGEVVDIATSSERIMVLVRSPKGIWRNHVAEWLEYKEGAIKPTTQERAKLDVDLYRGYNLKMLEDLDAMSDSWTTDFEAQKKTPLGSIRV